MHMKNIVCNLDSCFYSLQVNLEAICLLEKARTVYDSMKLCKLCCLHAS